MWNCFKNVRISFSIKNLAKQKLHSLEISKFPELDFNYICEPNNYNEILNNVTRRKGVGNIKLVHELKKQLDSTDISHPEYEQIKAKLYAEALKIPNKTHSDVLQYTEDENVLRYVNNKKEFSFEPREFHEITKRLNLVRTEQLGNLSGNRSYYILGEMAELEQALINYSVKKLLDKGFEFMSVPDILNRQIIERCGMNTRGERTQVYSLHPEMFGPDLCLSGTSEMALAGFFLNKVLPIKDLPKKLAAVSRCYRAETSSVAEERGIYRVHQFTKVEMFVVTTPDLSESLLEELVTIEQELFGDLGLYLRVLDMPPYELGAPAYRKYDIEAWLPGRKIFGEVSSCSNCTDYQSRRLNIKYSGGNGHEHVHTLNGTACAIPRMLIALTETYQTDKGVIELPEALHKFMNDKKQIGRQKTIPELRLIKHKKEK